MVFFLVLTVYLAEVRGHSFLSAFSFAAATGIKIVPLLLMPAFMLYFCRRSDRIRLFIVVGVFWVITAVPWAIHSPADFVENVFGYRGGGAKNWGIGAILSNIPAFHYLASRAFGRLGAYILLLAMILMACLLNRQARRARLFYQFGILLYLFPLLAPGFAVQYLAWFNPWIVVLPWRVVTAYLAVSGLYCAVVYTYWSGGLPWYFANSVPTRGAVNVAGFSVMAFSVWLMTVIVLLAYYQLLCVENQERKTLATAASLPDSPK
jgi:uncharacterized membrane protein